MKAVDILSSHLTGPTRCASSLLTSVPGRKTRMYQRQTTTPQGASQQDRRGGCCGGEEVAGRTRCGSSSARNGHCVRSAIAGPSVEAFVLQEAVDVRLSIADDKQTQDARTIHEVEAVRLAAGRRTSSFAAMQSIVEKSFANLRDGRNLANDAEAFPRALVGPGKNPIQLPIGKSPYLMTRTIRNAHFEPAGRDYSRSTA
jgi:hypothetical protein